MRGGAVPSAKAGASLMSGSFDSVRLVQAIGLCFCRAHHLGYSPLIHWRGYHAVECDDFCR